MANSVVNLFRLFNKFAQTTPQDKKRSGKAATEVRCGVEPSCGGCEDSRIIAGLGYVDEIL